MASARLKSSERGFSIIETMIAVGLLTTISLSVAQLFAVAAKRNLDARAQTSTTILAVQKMEQLRGLTWGFDTTGLGLPVSDTTTDLSVDPPSASGRGLNASPTGTLDGNTPGYVDYIDVYGDWVGTGASPPTNTTFIRRWSVEPLPTNPNNTLILQVLVTPSRTEAMGAGTGPRRRLPDDSWLVTVKTRKAP